MNEITAKSQVELSSSQVPSGNLSHSYGKSPCFMGKSTINGHVQQLCKRLPEDIDNINHHSLTIINRLPLY